MESVIFRSLEYSFTLVNCQATATPKLFVAYAALNCTHLFRCGLRFIFFKLASLQIPWSLKFLLACFTLLESFRSTWFPFPTSGAPERPPWLLNQQSHTQTHIVMLSCWALSSNTLVPSFVCLSPEQPSTNGARNFPCFSSVLFRKVF